MSGRFGKVWMFELLWQNLTSTVWVQQELSRWSYGDGALLWQEHVWDRVDM